jgi:hypothetical protein
MSRKIRITRLAALALAASAVWLSLSTPTATAEPHRWDVGAGIAVGSFGIGGAYAREQRAEGGLALQPSLRVRVGQWEGEAAIAWRFGNADAPGMSSYLLTSMAAYGKRYLSLGCRPHRRGDGDTCLELYVRGGVERAWVSRPMDEAVFGLGYGTGLRLGLRAGRRNRVKYSTGWYVDFGGVYTPSGPEGSVGGSRIESFTVGWIWMGLGG